MGESYYEDRLGNFFVIRGEVPPSSLPEFVQLTTLDFSTNSHFVETPQLKFKANLSGLGSSIQRDFKDNAHNVDDGVEGEEVRLVQ